MSGRLVNDSPIYESLAMEFHARRVAELLADDDARLAKRRERWSFEEKIVAAAIVAFLLALVVLLATGGTR